MHIPHATGGSAGPRAWLLSAALLLGCGDGVVGPAEPLDAGNDETIDGGVEVDPRVIRRPDAGSSDASRPSSDASSSTGGSCGDVQAADHPPFEAIERLATTREQVRVLVYGQSISEQSWWEKTKAWLAETYPDGDLVMEEHARGGCAAQCLVGQAPWGNGSGFGDGLTYNRLPEDVFAWKPDLIIFHVFGNHNDYQYIMNGLKEGCAAFDDYRNDRGEIVPTVRCTDAQRALSAGYRAPEVLVQNDFVNETQPETCAPNPTSAQWDCFMNDKVIPEAVAEHGYVLQDNFHRWNAQARALGIDPGETVMPPPDGIHLSEAGNEVMLSLTLPHLCYAR